MANAEFIGMINAYVSLREQRKSLDKQMDDLKSKIKHIIEVTCNPDGENIVGEAEGWIYGIFTRNHYTIDDDALKAKLTEMGKFELIELKPTVNDIELLELLKQGELSSGDFNDCLIAKKTKALQIERKALKKYEAKLPDFGEVLNARIKV